MIHVPPLFRSRLGVPRGDARLDLTDLYAFPNPEDSGKSILIMNVHPSVHDFLDHQSPLKQTAAEAFAPEAVYELKIDTNGDAIADIAYRVRFSSSNGGAQTARLRRVEGAQAAGMGDGGRSIFEGAAVSTDRPAQVTKAGDYRFFAGWRSDPFFFDRRGAVNNLKFTGDDFFVDKNVCSIVIEVPNSDLGNKKVGLWHRTLIRMNGASEDWGPGRARRAPLATLPRPRPFRRRERGLPRRRAGERWQFRLRFRACSGAHRRVCERRRKAAGRDNAAGSHAL